MPSVAQKNGKRKLKIHKISKTGSKEFQFCFVKKIDVFGNSLPKFFSVKCKNFYALSASFGIHFEKGGFHHVEEKTNALLR